MKRCFLTHIVPEGQEIETKVSFATCNFSRNLMSGDVFDEVYSILPVYVDKCFVDEAKVRYVCLGMRKWGGVFCKLAAVMEQLKLFFKIKKGSSLWLYNMSLLNEFLYVALRWFKPSVKIYTIVLDFTPGAQNNERLLRRINSSDGLIVLANNALFENKNKVCLPGVVPADAGTDLPRLEAPIAKRFLLSGVLNEEISQISKILRVFADLPDCELHITGRIENEKDWSQYAMCKNIHHHGKLSWDKYLDLMHSCPFILSTRDPYAPENQCNFPSKIIESLLHNRIVVSTIDYSQLDDIRIYKIPNDTQGMLDGFERLVAMCDTELIKYANQSDRTKELFGVSEWRVAMDNIEHNKS